MSALRLFERFSCYCSVIVVASRVYVRLVPVRSNVRAGTFCRFTPVQVGGPHIRMVQDGLAVRKGINVISHEKYLRIHK